MDLGDFPQGRRHGVGCVRVEVGFHRGLGRGPSSERGPFVLAREALARCQVDKMFVVPMPFARVCKDVMRYKVARCRDLLAQCLQLGNK